MSSSRSTNQMPRRRSRRNRRNRQQPQTPPANQTAPRIIFSPKLKYANSRHDDNGVLILSTRKRPLPTAEELEDRKRKKTAIQAKQISKAALRHKVVSLHENGCNKNDEWRFGPACSKKIIKFLQAHFPRFAKKDAAKTFFYRTMKKQRTAAVTPHLDPFR